MCATARRYHICVMVMYATQSEFSRITSLTFAGVALTSAAMWAPSATVKADDKGSCFGNSINHDDAAKIARNTVFIAGVHTDGTLTSSASGFLVRGPRGVRIVTAFHVVDPDAREPSSTLMVFFSDGTPLGVPRVVAAAEPYEATVSGLELTVNDVAVLEIARFAEPAASQRLSRLDGLQVAAGGRLMVGETYAPTAVAWGYSGAAAVDARGHVVGVLTSADFRGHVSVNLATIQETKPGTQRVPAAVTLPDRSLVIVEPLRDPAITQELKPMSPPSGRQQTTKVIFAGFPMASCASTSAHLQPAASSAGAELLRKWRLMDQSDAWWIPPRFSIKTVSFSYR
jgi:hypothetical protein